MYKKWYDILNKVKVSAILSMSDLHVQSGRTALMFGSQRHNLYIVFDLVQKGATLDIQNKVYCFYIKIVCYTKMLYDIGWIYSIDVGFNVWSKEYSKIFSETRC